MNKLIFSILIFTGCVLPRNVENYFKQDSVNQKNEIIFSKFFYIDNKLVGEGYFFYKNSAVREKHYYYAGNEHTIEFYNKNGKFKGIIMTDSIYKATHPK
jgi:hypothetical protein